MRGGGNEQYYTFSEGQMFFCYYPASGVVKPSNHVSALRAIEHFAKRGFDINWLSTNVQRLHITVSIPEHLDKEEIDNLICTTTEELVEAYKIDKKNARDKRILNNIDNNTKEPIKEESLRVTLSQLKKSNKTRDEVADFFNKYNIEDGRPEKPIVQTLTKSKSVIVEEGKNILYRLFEKGELKKLTPEEIESKMKKFNN